MTTFPLTPDGAAAKLDELYALTPQQLATEAKAIRADFKTWLTANFTLTTLQSACLSRMDVNTTDYYGAQCAFCFYHKLDIELVDPGAPSPTGYVKWSKDYTTVKTISNPEGDSATGKLTFEMEYKPL